jgi:hypothetical protein
MELKALSTGYNQENKIMVDLEYKSFFYKEKRRKENEKAEMIFINKLRAKVFPCCDWFETEDKLLEEVLLW